MQTEQNKQEITMNAVLKTAAVVALVASSFAAFGAASAGNLEVRRAETMVVTAKRSVQTVEVRRADTIVVVAKRELAGAAVAANGRATNKASKQA
jgi:outer membrane cobalamin receptor